MIAVGVAVSILRMGRRSPGARIAAGSAALFAVILLVASMGATLSASQAACGSMPPEEMLLGSVEGVPKQYIPLYQGAAAKYELGTQGPSILAGIHKIETDFGRLDAPGVSSGENFAGAGGPMQFLAATWAAYGADGNGDGTKDRYEPADAFYGAANYLSASGAPGNWHDAIFAYNHAEWYVDDILSHAERFSGATSSQLTAATSTQSASTSASISGLKPSYEAYALEVAADTGLSPRVVGAWTLAEGGPDDNPLNIGPGQHFSDVEGAARATVDLLATPLYEGIMRAARSGTDQEQLEAIVASPWCPASSCPGYMKLLQSAYAQVRASGSVAQPLADECKAQASSGGEQIGELGEGDPDPLALIKNPRITLDAEAIGDLRGYHVSPKLVAVLAAISEEHRIAISVLSTGHSMRSNHIPGRGADIAIVDGEVCNAAANGRRGACWTLAQELDAIDERCYQSTELIYFFDPGDNSPGSFGDTEDHGNHIHLGWDGPGTSLVFTYPEGTDPCSPEAINGG